ncbi:MAG: cytochrome d ubiquinol oxidase subunit II [Bacteroidales bacterium]
MTYAFLQQYWWFLISLLGALLVFLMFVQGGNAQLLFKGLSLDQKRMIVNSTGRKWELTFTTLVTFGGAFFASFPLFYSTSFGGAYWVWILLLITFVFQAVSYEFQNKKGNLLGSQAFRIFLFLNGVLAPLVVGTAVGTFFTGSDFIVDKGAIIGLGAVSSWGSAWHGLEAIISPAVILGLVVMFLDSALGCLYVMNNVNDEDLDKKLRRNLLVFSGLFLVSLVAWLVVMFTMNGYAVTQDGTVLLEKSKYLHNFLQMPAVAVMFVVGAVLLVLGLYLGVFSKSRKGIWPAGIGTVLAVLALFFVAGFNGTAYYPSSADLQSSLTIANSSSSEFTLKAMFWVSLLIPFVAAYIAYAWSRMDRKPIDKDEINDNENKY